MGDWRCIEERERGADGLGVERARVCGVGTGPCRREGVGQPLGNRYWLHGGRRLRHGRRGNCVWPPSTSATRGGEPPAESVEGECARTVREITLRRPRCAGSWEKSSDAVIPLSSGYGRPIIFVPLLLCCKTLSLLLATI